MRARLLTLTVSALAFLSLPGTTTASAFPLHSLPMVARGAAAPAVRPRAAGVPDVTVAGVEIAKAAPSDTPKIVRAAKWLQCVPFARALTGIDIRGNAVTWWAKAKGAYAKLTSPKPGAVMVFAGTRHLKRGHVAVVKDIVSPREVRVDHANWGNDGRIYLNAPVFDVSPGNDWSEVRVWNVKLGVLGSHTYKLAGFIGT